MNRLETRDLGGGRVEARWRGSGDAIAADPVAFASPLSEEDREELRWYLEQYRLFPFGANQEGAAVVEMGSPKEGEPFRILLVIARPWGEHDIGLRTVARPVLDRR